MKIRLILFMALAVAGKMAVSGHLDFLGEHSITGIAATGAMIACLILIAWKYYSEIWRVKKNEE